MGSRLSVVAPATQVQVTARLHGMLRDKLVLARALGRMHSGVQKLPMAVSPILTSGACQVCRWAVVCQDSRSRKESSCRQQNLSQLCTKQTNLQPQVCQPPPLLEESRRLVETVHLVRVRLLLALRRIQMMESGPALRKQCRRDLRWRRSSDRVRM